MQTSTEGMRFEMDFHSMKRKELQALCKKHHIPANLTNLEMANKLTSLLKEKEKPMTRGRSCLKNIDSENDSDVLTRQFKKVRFSPENEMIEFVHLGASHMKAKRVKKRDKVIENVDKIELSNETADKRVRITRSQAQKSVEEGVIPVLLSPLIEKKRAKRGVNFDSMEVKDVDRSDGLLSVTDLSDNLASDSAVVEESRVLVVRRTLRNREVVGENKKEGEGVGLPRKRNAKGSDGITVNKGLAPDGGITQPEKVLRRSKRNTTKDGDDELLNGDLGENEMVGRGRSTKTETEIEVQGDSGEEPLRGPGRNRNRRKSVENVGTVGPMPEIPEENDKVSLPNVPLRRSRRNTIMIKSEELAIHGAVGGNKSPKQSREPFVEKEVPLVEQLVRRSRKSDTRHESVAISDAMDVISSAIGKNKPPRKRRRDHIQEECASLIEEPPRRSTRNTAKSHTVAPAVVSGKVGGKKQDSKSKSPKLQVEAPLAESISALESPPMPEVAETTSYPVLSSGKAKKRKESNRKSLPKMEVCAGKSDLDETRDLIVVSSVESPVSMHLQLQSDCTEKETDMSVSDSAVVTEKESIPIGVDKEKPLQDDICRVDDDDDSASHSWERSGDFDCNNFVEQELEELLNMANDDDLRLAETTPVVDGCSPVYQSDSITKILDLGKELETDEKPSAVEEVHRSHVVANHGVEGDKASVHMEHNSIEPEGDGFEEPIIHELVLEGHLAELNQKGGSKKNLENNSEEAGEVSVIDPSDGIRATPIVFNNKKIVEAEKSADCRSEIHNIEVETSSIKNISAFEEPPISYAGLSEPKGAEHASGSNKERKGWSTRTSSFEKQHSSVEYCAKSADSKGTRDTMVVNLEGTPASDSVKLLSDSAEQGTNISVSGSLVAAEKENIIVVVGNENLLQDDDTHKGNEYDLVSQSQKRSGAYDSKTLIDPDLVEDQTNVSDAVPTETSSEADGFLPVHQSDFMAGDNSSSVYKERNLVEFEEVHSFAEPSHLTGFDESEGAPENCANESDRATEFGALDPSDERRISPNSIGGENEEAEYSVEATKLQETTSVSDAVAAKIVAEKDIEVKFTNSYCSTETPSLKPIIFPECQASSIGDEVTPSTGHALSIDNDAQQQDGNHPKVKLSVQSNMPAGDTNHVRIEENSSHENAIYDGTLHRGDTLVSNPGDEMCNQERFEEASTEMENKPEGASYMERALQGVDEEASFEGVEEISFVDANLLPVLNDLDGQLAKEKENAGSKRNCVHVSEEIKEGRVNEFSDGERINQTISEERDTDRIEDTLTPITAPKSSRIVKNESLSSSEYTPPKDDIESGEDELKILFATPANSGNPNEEEETSSSEIEIADVTMAKCVAQEVVGTRESEREKMAYKGNALPTASEEITDDRSHGEVDTESTGANGSSYNALDGSISANGSTHTALDGSISANGSTHTALDGSFSKDGYVVEDKESGLSKPNCEIALGEGTCVNVLEVPVGAGIPLITSEERGTSKTENFEEAAERNGFVAEPYVVGADTDSKCSEGAAPCMPSYASEYQASGTRNKEMLSAKHTFSVDNDNEDREKNNNVDAFADVPFNKSTSVMEAKDDGKDMEEDLDIECNSLANEEGNSEVLPVVEICDPCDCEGVAQTNGSAGASLAETICKESEIPEEKLTAELTKSTSKCIKRTNMQEEDSEGALSPSGPAPGVSDEISDEVAEEKLILTGAEVDLDCNDSDDALMMNRIMPEHDQVDCGGSGEYKDEMVWEQDKSTSASNRHHLEHEKVLNNASLSPFNVSNCDGEDYESIVYQGDLSIAEGKEMTEIVPDDGFNDAYGLTVSSPASVDFDEDRVDKEEALEEDAFMSDGCLASNKPLCGDEIESRAEKSEEASSSLHDIGDIVLCAGHSNSAQLQNFGEASILKPAAASLFSLSANHGTTEHRAFEFDFESHMFSSWEINLLLGDDNGDGVEKSCAGASETNFVCKDTKDAREVKENVTDLLAEEQLGMHHMEEKTAEVNDSRLIDSDERICEEEAPKEEKDVVITMKEYNDCEYGENESVRVEKSSVSMHDVILTEVANMNDFEPAASAASVDFKYSEVGSISNIGIEDIESLVECGEKGEAIELSEAVIKPNSRMSYQSPPFIDSAVDGGLAAEDAQKWQPKSEFVERNKPTRQLEEGNGPAKQFNSTTMKKKNDRTGLIQSTPKKLITTLDMKENALGIKREHLGNVTTVTKRRALEDLQKK